MMVIPVAEPDKIFGLTLFLDFIDRCHSLRSLHPPPAALPSLPTGLLHLDGSIPEGTKKENHPYWGGFFFGDPYGNRTHVTAVKGRCLNRLTNGPGSGDLIRTGDIPGMNRVLYQLSYAAICFGIAEISFVIIYGCAGFVKSKFVFFIFFREMMIKR